MQNMNLKKSFRLYGSETDFGKLRNNNIIETPNLDYDPDPRGLGYVYYQCMLKNEDRLAQIYGPTGERDTFGEVLQRSIRVTIAMRNMNIKPGDFISICTFNHLDSCVPVIASFFVGCIMAAVDPTISLEDTILLLKQVPPKVIFVHPDAVQMIEETIQALNYNTKIIVFGKTEKHISYADFLQPNDDEVNFKPAEAKNVKDTAIIYFSSGTTGLPKGVCQSHYSILCCTRSYLECGLNFNLFLAYASPYWTIFLCGLSNSIMSGGARLVYPKYDLNSAWKIFDHKPTTVLLNTIQILTMLGQGRPKNLNVNSVKDILLVGGILMVDQIIKIRKMLHEIKVHQAYGLTEIFGPVLIFKPRYKTDLELISKKPASTGSGMPGILYKVVDIETEKILGPSQQGELRMKTEIKLNGYHNRDSSDACDSDGWLKTGDVAYYDDDKCFYIVDRIKEMFKFQCWHIVPAILENVLLTHPAIEIAIVIGKPDELDGDHPMGIVQLKVSDKKVTPKEIEEYVEQRVQDRQRLRAGVKIVDHFPMTASGKVNRRKLRQMVIDGKI